MCIQLNPNSCVCVCVWNEWISSLLLRGDKQKEINYIALSFVYLQLCVSLIV